jgi:hypothetical protein
MSDKKTLVPKALYWVSCSAFLLSSLPALAIPSRTATPRGVSFAQLSSKIDQKPGGFVQFESKDSLTRVTATANAVTVKQSGAYLIIASPQVTAIKDGGCFDAWLVVNGKNVENSGVRLCQAKAGNTDVIVSQAIMTLKAGDRIQVKTSGKDVKMDAIAPQGEPLIPSIIFSILGLY